uniref:Uncharacterized protein n=1 Tax=Rhizophora mucronata TaxID=61149 RepID=A0A2P2NXY6_RHIMU
MILDMFTHFWQVWLIISTDNASSV